MNPTNAIVQLNKYDREKYNVLVPVTTMQVASNLQRITVSEVQLDVRQNSSNNGPSKDIYYEKSSSAYAITKVGGMKLAASQHQHRFHDPRANRGLRPLHRNGESHRQGSLLRELPPCA